MPSYTIEDRDNITSVAGTIIGHAGTNTAKQRWMEITLYRLDSGLLLLHRVSYSRVYHDNTGRCRTTAGRVSGSPATVDDLPDDAEPCLTCEPADPEYLGDTETIKFEYPRHTFDNCASPDDVEARLVNPRTGRMSEPSKSVLDQARQNDKEFADRPKMVVSY